MGKRKLYLACSTDTCDILNVPNLVKSLSEHVDPREVALAAYMHWEVGRLNMGETEEFNNRLQTWYNVFVSSCARVELIPTESLVRLCVAVAAADIAAGTNIRLTKPTLPIQYNVDRIPDNIHTSSDAWTKFHMDKQIHGYQSKIIEFVNNELSRAP